MLAKRNSKRELLSTTIHYGRVLFKLPYSYTIMWWGYNNTSYTYTLNIPDDYLYKHQRDHRVILSV